MYLTIGRAMVLTMLVAGFVLPPLFAYQAVYAAIVSALVLGIVGVLRDPALLRVPGVFLVALATLLMVVATVLSGPAALDWAGPGIVGLLLLSTGVPGARSLVPRAVTPLAVASLCLAGAVLGACVGAWEMGAGTGRAGLGNNPIHYSGIVVILGFCALSGLVATRSHWRMLFLLGPAAAFVASIASGSRGPMLATICLASLAWLILLIWYRNDRSFWVWSVAAGLSGILAFFVFGLESRAFVGLIGFLYGGSALTAGSDVIRESMLAGGWSAFLESPVWGHGYSDLIAAASQHVSNEEDISGFDHLHNDAIDFLVIAGMFGGLAYLLVLAAPLAVLTRFREPTARSTILIGAMLSSAYLVLGLTNAMIGVLPQTVLYALLLGCTFPNGRGPEANPD